MNDFIRERIRRGIFCDSLGTESEVTTSLHEKDIEEMRSLSISRASFGNIHSSIAIYKDKVLILNLSETPTAVSIRNREFAETMKTIYSLAKKGSNI